MRKLILLTLLLLAASPLSAQEESKVTVSAYTGVAAVVTRGEKTEYFQARGQLNAALGSGFTLFGRGELLGTQDGGSLDTLPDPSTFRSIEVVLGVRKSLSERFSAGGLGGVTYSVEGDIDAPSDPRLYTGIGVLRASIGKRGYVYFGGGHYGPVGGGALVAAASIPVTRDEHAYTFVDFALPLQSTAFSEKAYVLRTGVTVKLGEWGL